MKEQSPSDDALSLEVVHPNAAGIDIGNAAPASLPGSA